jgi:hypothetical protein
VELRAQPDRQGAIAWQIGPQVTPIAAIERRCRTLQVVEFVEVHASAAGQDAEAVYRADEEAFQG